MDLKVPFFSKSQQCEGEMDRISDGYIVQCNDCDGPSDLSHRRCFRGLANRIHPGYKGEIVLRSNMDVSYSGIAIEALQSFSDIDHMFKVLIEKASNGNTSRKGLKILKKAREDFIEDPLLFNEKRKAILGNSPDDEISTQLTEIFERTSLMMRRLQKK